MREEGGCRCGVGWMESRTGAGDAAILHRDEPAETKGQRIGRTHGGVAAVYRRARPVHAICGHQQGEGRAGFIHRFSRDKEGPVITDGHAVCRPSSGSGQRRVQPGDAVIRGIHDARIPAQRIHDSASPDDAEGVHAQRAALRPRAAVERGPHHLRPRLRRIHGHGDPCAAIMGHMAEVRTRPHGGERPGLAITRPQHHAAVRHRDKLTAAIGHLPHLRHAIGKGRLIPDAPVGGPADLCR